ncbi:MAG: Mur ligase family protein [Bacteroidetes bacterium]|nr:Mur ligase family protein [Bacteroidota bacterium]MCY4232646.1 Mur ligase family protein [Bacteroidota bacterium]
MATGYSDRLLNLPRYSELGHKAIRPGVDGVSRLLEAMGNPHHKFASVHVAGTNGKGSVASMISAIGQVAGYRTGLYTSPHLLHLSERIRINGIAVSDQWMDRALDRYASLFSALQPTFFEAMTALSFLYFSELSVDLAVVETGLGGRLDATNILQPKLSVITKIDLDHTQTLGNTLTAITHEKAGIIKKNTPVIAATGYSFTQKIAHHVASSVGAPWIEPGQVINGHLHTHKHVYELPEDLRPSGAHQAENALLAVQSSEILFPEILHDPSLVYRGLSKVRELTGLRARLETLNEFPLTILDVAHNPAGISAALNYVPSTGTVYLLLSLMKDKDLAGVAQALIRHRSLKIFLCELALRRAYSTTQIADTFRQSALDVAGSGPVATMWNDVQSQATKSDTILICGSHFLAEAFLKVYSHY